MTMSFLPRMPKTTSSMPYAALHRCSAPLCTNTRLLSCAILGKGILYVSKRQIHTPTYLHTFVNIDFFWCVCVCECVCRHVFIDRCVWAWRSTVWQTPQVLNRFGGEILCFGSSMILHHTLLGYGGHKSYEGQIDAHGEQGCQCRLLRYHLKALFKPQLGHKDLQTLVGQTVY